LSFDEECAFDKRPPFYLESQLSAQAPLLNVAQFLEQSSKHGRLVGTGVGCEVGLRVIVGTCEGIGEEVGNKVGLDFALQRAAWKVAWVQS
jgi:hypothetical protein